MLEAVRAVTRQDVVNMMLQHVVGDVEAESNLKRVTVDVPQGVSEEVDVSVLKGGKRRVMVAQVCRYIYLSVFFDY